MNKYKRKPDVIKQLEGVKLQCETLKQRILVLEELIKKIIKY